MRKMTTADQNIAHLQEKRGYPDLRDQDYVYQALLGYGMFSNKIPPCFSSKCLLDTSCEPTSKHSYIHYASCRHTGVSRYFGIPHPESHMALCQAIRGCWEEINEHIGKPEKKFNFCHVRKIRNQSHIFEMNYDGADKWVREELEQDYYLGCAYIVKTDISNCFPSMYTHSIPWAVRGISHAKDNKSSGDWPNSLDKAVRNCKDQETNGLLIGPHTSNIIGEIILTKIDCHLQDKGFKKVIRHIDDYRYFAKDEDDAKSFIKCLELELKRYELLLNQKKTSIIPISEYFHYEWPRKLSGYILPDIDIFGFTIVNAFLNYAISLATEINDWATVHYAIKRIASYKEKLSDRAKRLYVKKLLALSIVHPYLIPHLENYIFCFMNNISDDLQEFLPALFKLSEKSGATEPLSFCFYFAIKYKIEIRDLQKDWVKKVFEFDDCISMLLAYRYAKKFNSDLSEFKYRIETLISEWGDDKRKQDKFWLLMFEYATNANEIPETQEFLRCLKNENITFMDFNLSHESDSEGIKTLHNEQLSI